MALDGQNAAMQTENHTVIPILLETTQQAFDGLDTLFTSAKGIVKLLIPRHGRFKSFLIEQHHASMHGLSWLALYY